MSGCMKSRPGLRIAPVGKESSVSTIRLQHNKEKIKTQISKIPIAYLYGVQNFNLHTNWIPWYLLSTDSELLLQPCFQLPRCASWNSVLHISAIMSCINLQTVYQYKNRTVRNNYYDNATHSPPATPPHSLLHIHSSTFTPPLTQLH
jgi:hypothetical protein